MLGSLLTQWTIRLALACLALTWGSWLWLACSGELANCCHPGKCPPDSRKTRATGTWFTALRWIWTAGCVLFVAHVACAFHFTHGWSHAHAWQHTAAETERLMGFSFGDGIYFSYMFLLLWVGDVAQLWLNVQRPAWLVAGVYLFLFFIAFNGAIVFEDGPTRPVGMAVVAVLAALLAVAVGKYVWQRAAGSSRALSGPNSRAEVDA